ncbi:MAG: thioredoxin family protein [Proteobacteria bacterium]|nr:thioredoxin family protein [Pseudomonadota bacterium]
MIGEDIWVELVMAGDHQGALLEAALDVVALSEPHIHVKKKKNRDQGESCILIRKNLLFKALPQGKMLNVFLDLLSSVILEQQTILNDKDVVAPVLLKLFVAPFCAHCPSVVKDIARLPINCDFITLEIIDGTLFDDHAKRHNILSAPTVVCDGTYRWTGPVSCAEILDTICKRKPEELGVDSLRSMVENGKASSLAELMIKENKIFPAFYDLLIHEKWPVRLGAMVAVEILSQGNACLTEHLMNVLWAKLPYVSDPVKGDMIYLAGEVGGRTYIRELNCIITQTTNPDIIDSIHDALESLGKRHSS